MELFKAKDHHGVDLGLGITCNGVSVFKGRTLITTFAWYVCTYASTYLQSSLSVQNILYLAAEIKVLYFCVLSCRMHIVKITYKRKKFYIELRPELVSCVRMR